MSIPKHERRYLDYEGGVDASVKDCLMANWGHCPSCKSRAFPVAMRAFEYWGEIYFEGACLSCGKITIAAYNSVID